MSQMKVWDGSAWVPAVVGAKGDKGDTGSAGAGFPAGGTTGQALVKKSGTDYDTQWTTIQGGSGTSTVKTKFATWLTKALGPTNAFPTANTGLVSNVTNTAISGAVVYPYNSGKFYFRGLYPTVYTNGSGTTYYRNNTIGNISSTTGALNNNYSSFWVEFDYYGSNFDVRFNPRNTTVHVWIWIDGVPTTTSSVTLTVTKNVDNYYNVLLPTTAERRIRVMLSYADFGGIGLQNITETIFPVEQKLLKVVLQDGSWFAGGNGGTTATPASANLSTQLGEMLNADYYNCAISGTGYVRGGNVDPILGYITNPGNNPNWCDSTRLEIIKNIAPDLIVFLGTTNDDNYTASSYQLQAHAKYVYDYFANNLPDTKLAVFTRGSNTDTGANLTANANAVYAAATDPAVSNVVCAVDVFGEEWVTGTSTSGSPNNTGNGQVFVYSDLHLNGAGNKYYASKMFSRIFDSIKTYTRS